METHKLIQILEHKEVYAEKVCMLIKQVVSSYYNMPISAFKSRSRLRPIIKMKQTCVYFMRKFLPKSTLSYIGQQTNYNHCSVIYSIKQIKGLYEFDKEIKKDIDAITQVIEIEQGKLRLDGDLSNEYYYVNLNNCFSAKFFNGKGIVLEGFDAEEADKFIQLINQLYEENLKLREHLNTGVYLLEKTNKNINF